MAESDFMRQLREAREESLNRRGGSGGGTPPPQTPGARDTDKGQRDKSSKDNAKQVGLLGKTMKGVVKATASQPKWWARGMKAAGVSMGLSGVLKQSQVFTGTLGAIFQILGAMVDVFLAPFIKPVFMPFIKKMSSWIPKVKAAGEITFKWLEAIWPKVFAVLKFFGSIIGNVVSWIWRNFSWPLLKSIGKLFGFLAKNIGEEVETSRARGTFKADEGWNTKKASAGWLDEEGRSTLRHRGPKQTVIPVAEIQKTIKKVTAQQLATQAMDDFESADLTSATGLATMVGSGAAVQAAGTLAIVEPIVHWLEKIYRTGEDQAKAMGRYHEALRTISAGSKTGLQLQSHGRDRSIDLTSAAFNRLTPEQQSRRVREAYDPDDARFRQDIQAQHSGNLSGTRFGPGSVAVEFAAGLAASSWNGTGYWDE
tara:strand:+ start:85 stop:1359 length:1275 start_codon:yes stop_codon:yes gene_type:complete